MKHVIIYPNLLAMKHACLKHVINLLQRAGDAGMLAGDEGNVLPLVMQAVSVLLHYCADHVVRTGRGTDCVRYQGRQTVPFKMVTESRAFRRAGERAGCLARSQQATHGPSESPRSGDDARRLGCSLASSRHGHAAASREVYGRCCGP